ncbi:hypothetical protein AN237_25695 (plasmid) [Raoultella ornithinolytica]|uniref:hypothetical protein n=1 Tax=Raoultella ornithinolytica TaxID=54291 RepID=UPI00084A0A98|nr:hypothetical protein [Raoultella ornithinolytica]AOO59934.1 hypothetical protein AN237_25695 [Raoultella ornithinolytica]
MNNTPALYEAVDAKILEKVGKHPKAFVDIYFPETYTLCVEILNDNKKEPARILDRRLQALRKKGLIHHVTGKGWVKMIPQEGKEGNSGV